VPPAVAEVVVILEPCLEWLGHAIEMHDVFVDRRHVQAVWIGDHRAVAFACNHELMQMRVYVSKEENAVPVLRLWIERNF
jgi:hypothetical protein